jgi:environmental stress-induced protein Ves
MSASMRASMRAAVPLWSLQPLVTAPRQPWANGGGWTQELLAWSPEADGSPPDRPPEWHLRVSVAQVGGPGPFSVLPGVQRWMVPLSGGTLELAWPPSGEATALGPGALPCRFDGADAPSVLAASGAPARLLNLMVRAELGQGRLEPAVAGSPAPIAPWRAVFSEAAVALPTAGGLLSVPPLTLAWQAASEALAPCTLIDAPGPAWWLAWGPRGA